MSSTVLQEKIVALFGFVYILIRVVGTTMANDDAFYSQLYEFAVSRQCSERVCVLKKAAKVYKTE